MQVIVSHDIDHLSAWEHWRDPMLPKYWVRSCIECALGRIGARELMIRARRIVMGRWENIEAVMAFDDANKVPSTFFVGMHNGRQLSYPLSKAKEWVKRVQSKGFDVGVHGIEFKAPDGIRREFDHFKEASGMDRFGIRMHCLSRDENTLDRLENVGYRFDSSVMGLERPYRVGRLWELPLQVMDGDIICGARRWQSRNLDQAKDKTLGVLARAKECNMPYFNILFHDFYYCDGFATWKRWYEWLIRHLKEEGYVFVSLNQAVAELEATNGHTDILAN